MTKDFIIYLASSTCFNYLYCVLQNSVPVLVECWLFLEPFSKSHEFVSSNACYSFLFVQYCLRWEETRDNCLEECWIFLKENWIAHSVFKILVGCEMTVITEEIEAEQFWWNNDVGIIRLQNLGLFYCMPQLVDQEEAYFSLFHRSFVCTQRIYFLWNPIEYMCLKLFYPLNIQI